MPAPAADPETLQHLLDTLPPPAEPLDVVMLDGFLCALLLRSAPPAVSAWLPWALDIDGRPLPAASVTPAKVALEQRLRSLHEAVAHRQWFDPWVFELEDDTRAAEAVVPWAAGFALAAERWPLPLPQGAAGDEALALIYQYLDPDDWPAAAALAERIDELEPPGKLAEAVEDLVRAVLLLSDVTGPRAIAARPQVRARGAAKPRSIGR
jgi:uncharacterized protein